MKFADNADLVKMLLGGALRSTYNVGFCAKFHYAPLVFRPPSSINREGATTLRLHNGEKSEYIGHHVASEGVLHECGEF